MSRHDDKRSAANDNSTNGGNEHFDEIDAVRRFPSEDEWLDLPAPDLSDDGSEPQPSFAESFADRVMQARKDELELDAELAQLDKDLPNELLQQFGAPDPSAAFVDDTVKAVMNDRRQRWQQMLSRYVAPEPSPEFVSRTLAALNEGKATGGAPDATPRLPHRTGPRPRSNWPVFSLVAAAAAAMLWVLLTDAAPAPLELRMADRAPQAVAYASATSPMSAILATVAHEDEPFAVFDAPADGLWLVSDPEETQ